MLAPTLLITHRGRAVRYCTSRPPAGFTLIELLVAIVLLSLGLLAMASVADAVVRLERGGERLSRGAANAETRLELLRAAPCTSASGIGADGAVSERWVVTPAAPGIHELVDSVFANPWPHGTASGATHVDVYRSASRC
ncbi:MAG TPA: prepilin-type N-terminal cleavage/methylation domain-containing protein [Gemmatimonadaceae bacterium]|jgi:prepilin-type N-terminal cleavage/methylation domain